MNKLKAVLILIVFIIVLIVTLFFNWFKQNSCIGTITAINGNIITMLSDSFKQENSNHSQGDLIFEWKDSNKFQVGDRVKIYTKGKAATTFPAEVTVTKIEKLKK